MGVYWLPWTNLSHRYWYRGTFSVLNGTFSVLNSTFPVLNMGVYGVARLGSIHNTYNVPSEPERAAKARRAVVASFYLIQKAKWIFVQLSSECDHKTFFRISRTLKNCHPSWIAKMSLKCYFASISAKAYLNHIVQEILSVTPLTKDTLKPR